VDFVHLLQPSDQLVDRREIMERNIVVHEAVKRGLVQQLLQYGLDGQNFELHIGKSTCK
jgi:hypothetical protein